MPSTASPAIPARHGYQRTPMLRSLCSPFSSTRPRAIPLFRDPARGPLAVAVAPRLSSDPLLDEVLPRVPLRQWVLSLPYRLRYLLAWGHDLCRAVVGVYVRAVLGFLRARARHDGVANGRSGAVVMIQRFGGALNLNVHVHALVIDGVFA